MKIKFIYSEKATKFCEIFTLILTGTTWDKSKVKISQNCVAFSEYMNFTSNFANISRIQFMKKKLDIIVQDVGFFPNFQQTRLLQKVALWTDEM